VKLFRIQQILFDACYRRLVTEKAAVGTPVVG